MDSKMIFYMPSEIALILGKDRRDVLRWIESGRLSSIQKYGRAVSNAHDIVKFLHEHPEEVGRVYCDDLIPFFNQARNSIVELLEKLNEVSNLWQDYQSSKYQAF